MNGSSVAASRISFACGAMTAVVLLAAGLLKAGDVPAFRDSLATWKLFPAGASNALAWTIPYVEIGVALAWLIGPRRRAAAMVMLLVLCCGTGAYVVHLLFAEAPTCKCFGAMDRYLGDLWTTKAVLARNAVLIAAAFAGSLWAPAWRRRPGSYAERSLPVSAPVAARGFTLIEVLLVISIAGVLLSLAVPAVQRFRARARITVDLSNLRQHGVIFAAYSNDHKEVIPYITRAEWDYTVLRCEDRVVEAPYFHAAFVWPMALAPGYYGGLCGHRSFISPVTASHGAYTDYQYACSFLAQPGYWRDVTRRSGRAQWGPVRNSSVLWPSRKSLLSRVVDEEFIAACTSQQFDVVELSQLVGVPVPLSLVDGSSHAMAAIRVMQGYPESDTRASLHGADWPFALHALDGVRGVDVQ